MADFGLFGLGVMGQVRPHRTAPLSGRFSTQFSHGRAAPAVS